MKRLFDVVVVALSAPVWVPASAILAVIVRVKLGRPVLFTQRRPGLRAEPFTIYKFRTMTDARGTDGDLPDSDRLTSFGRTLRASSLDELPELWNVLKGDMSLVGPRPLLMEYIPLYSAEQARRHAVRPGITGFAQVNGRNDTTWEDRLGMDVWYVENRSMLLDLKILWLTIVRVIQRQGISHLGQATMPKFTGSRG